jgi:DNA-binding MarR family transcriptional regulator
MEQRVALARLLAAAARQAIDEVHSRLSEEGHPGIRPAHGYALVALGEEGLTIAGLGERLGITKQGAGKLVTALEDLGYITREADADDRRAQRVSVSARGADLLAKSVAAQADLERRWGRQVGREQAATLRSALEQIVGTGDPGTVLAIRPLW